MKSEEAALVLDQVKLLFVFDALLREGSVSAAARSLGLQTSAVSRLLSKLREHYGDPILVRTGKGMRPTAFAEDMRLALRAFATTSETLLESREATQRPDARITFEEADWGKPSVTSPPPLAVKPESLLEGEPSPDGIARRLAALDQENNPQTRLAQHIGYTASGPGRSRPLAEEEAYESLRIILAGEADALQIGALMTAISYRGATAPELAGFIRAIQEKTPLANLHGFKPDLDWPAYVSPRWRSAPWFVHSARLVAMQGHKVLVHGHHGGGQNGGKIEEAIRLSGKRVCERWEDIGPALVDDNLAYVPIGVLCPQIHAFLSLYPLLQMRTPINMAINLCNPAGAPAIIAGAASNASLDLFGSVYGLLGYARAAFLNTSRDFAQATPERAMQVNRYLGKALQEFSVPSGEGRKETVPTEFSQMEYWHGIWTGAARDAHAELSIQHTAALAFLAISEDPAFTYEDAFAQARRAWLDRGA